MKKMKNLIIVIVFLLVPALMFSMPHDKKEKNEIRFKINGKEKVINLDFDKITDSLSKLKGLKIKMDGMEDIDIDIDTDELIGDIVEGVNDTLEELQDLDIELKGHLEGVDEVMEAVNEGLRELKNLDLGVDIKELKREIRKELKEAKREIKKARKELKKRIKEKKRDK